VKFEGNLQLDKTSDFWANGHLQISGVEFDLDEWTHFLVSDGKAWKNYQQVDSEIAGHLVSSDCFTELKVWSRLDLERVKAQSRMPLELATS
jgi:hypothetical protein